MVEYILVVIDAYTRYPEVDIVHSTSVPATIAKLDRIFGTHGLPCKVKSDNGPPFNSLEFANYMHEKGIESKPITPLWPQSNSEAENFNKPLEKTIRTAQAEGRKRTVSFFIELSSNPSLDNYALNTLLHNCFLIAKYVPNYQVNFTRMYQN